MTRHLETGSGSWRPWIGGGEDRSHPRATAVSVAPYDGRAVAEVEQADATDVDRAVAVAEECWAAHRREPGHERASWLRAAADNLEASSDALVDALVALIGKPRKLSVFEVRRGVGLLRLCGEEISRMHGENLVLDGVHGGDGRWGLTRREPFGVVAAITPFNAPVNLLLQKVGPALAMGNAVVVKPAPEGAVIALQIAEAIADAVPSGLLAVLPGGPDVALDLVARPQVRAVTLTGGVAAGEAVLAAAGIKPVSLELGSNAPNIVCADADVDRAAREIASAAFGASGQQCISAQRVIVQRPVLDAFVDLFVAAARELVVGDPADLTTDLGPLISDRARDRVRRHLEDAEVRGGKVVLDGRSDDLCFGPSVVREVPADALVLREEVFGPVAVVIPVDSVDEAIAAANDSELGLQASCFTSDVATAMRAAEELRAGSVWINEPTRFRLDTYPFGGYGKSGIGREGVRYAMEALSQLKFVGLRGI
jgi:acyl-CoA reductase-like NAD-dependent aldehyde dehydrogenase